jgi:hypothetical protein
MNLSCYGDAMLVTLIDSSHFSRRNQKLEDGHLVEGGDVGIQAAAAATKERILPRY